MTSVESTQKANPENIVDVISEPTEPLKSSTVYITFINQDYYMNIHEISRNVSDDSIDVKILSHSGTMATLTFNNAKELFEAELFKLIIFDKIKIYLGDQGEIDHVLNYDKERDQVEEGSSYLKRIRRYLADKSVLSYRVIHRMPEDDDMAHLMLIIARYVSMITTTIRDVKKSLAPISLENNSDEES